MNPYRDMNLSSGSPRLPPNSPSDLHDPPDSPPVAPVTQSGQSSVTDPPPHVAPSEQDGGQSVPQTSDQSGSPPPDPVYSLTPGLQSDLAVISPSVSNPYPVTPPFSQVSVIIPSPVQPHCSDDSCPDLECSICFSHFNNVFRCPKMLQCKHTFCLECLARINVKSAQPNAIQCPLCRSFTPLPSLGLPKLTTDSDVLSYLPAAMQRVYSIRFQRNKGKLKVKRSANSHHRWGQRSMNRSLDVGLPSPPSRGHSGGQSDGGGGGLGEALFRLTGRPVCRAVLLTSVVMMMVLLTGIVIFLITFNRGIYKSIEPISSSVTLQEAVSAVPTSAAQASSTEGTKSIQLSLRLNINELIKRSEFCQDKTIMNLYKEIQTRKSPKTP